MCRMFFSALVFLMAVTLSAQAEKGRVESAWKVATAKTPGGGTLTSVAFKSGANVRFHTGKNGKMTAVSLQSGKVKYDIPPTVAAKLRDVHYNTVTLGWDGGAKSAAQAKSVYLEFAVGTVKKFGAWPRVQLTFENGFFRKGKLVSAAVNTKSSATVWQSQGL